MAWHARLSASQTKQWWNCPGSLAVMEAFPAEQRPSGEHAQLGTCAHALIEECLGKNMDPEDFRDQIIVMDSEGEDAKAIQKKIPKGAQTVWFLIDDDMIDATSIMVNYVRERADELGVDYADIRLEERTNPLPERDDTGGSADVTIDAFLEELELIDYKNGSGVFVPIEGNKQTMSYLLGQAEKTQFSHDWYRHTIVQPRNSDARAHSPKGIMSEVVSRDDLLEFQKGLRKAAEHVDVARGIVSSMSRGSTPHETLEVLYDQGYVKCTPDGSHCTFCDLKAVGSKGCPALRNKAQDMANADFDDDPPEAVDMPPEGDLPKLLPWIPVMDKFFAALKAAARDRMFAGGSIEGYKVVRNNGQRAYRSSIALEEDGDPVEYDLTPEVIARVAEEEFDLPADELWEPRQIKSGPSIEKLIKGKGSGAKKAQFSERLMEKRPGSLAIAPESDSKPAVDLDPSSDFEDDDD